MEKLIPIIDVPYNKIAERVLVCGDPFRAETIANRLENVEVVAKVREYWTYNCTYKGVPITISSHGVGGSGASVSFEGLILAGAKCIIRFGTCGTMQEGMPEGSIIIATSACREDGITNQMVPASYPAVASYDIVKNMEDVAKEIDAKNVYIGKVVTGGVFYPSLLRTNNRILQKANTIAYENEASVLFTICGINNIKTGCVAAADGPAFEFVGPEDFNHYPEAIAKAKEDGLIIALESLIRTEI